MLHGFRCQSSELGVFPLCHSKFCGLPLWPLSPSCEGMEEGCGCVAMATGRDQHRPLPSLSNSSEMRSPAGPSSLPQCDLASGPWTGLACSWSFMWDVLAQTQQWTDSCLSSRDLLSSWLWIFPLASRYSGSPGKPGPW